MEGESFLHGTDFLHCLDGCGGPEEAVISDMGTCVWSALCHSQPFSLRETIYVSVREHRKENTGFILLVYIPDIGTSYVPWLHLPSEERHLICSKTAEINMLSSQ